MKDALGDRMKSYEELTSIRLMPRLPTLIRLDGRAFHSFTRGLKRPFDHNFNLCMVETMEALARETNARCAYTQSDEITLLLYSDDPKSQIWFDGKHSKIVSQAASLTTLTFYRWVCEMMPDYRDKLPMFDARCWQVPDKSEAVNAFLWRELDATRNSINMAAHSHFSQKELHKKNSSEKQDMLMSKGVNWNDFDPRFKRGIYCRRLLMNRKFTTDEIEELPLKHEARTTPDLIVRRSQVDSHCLPILSKIVNKESVIFDGAEPEIR